MFKHRLKQLLRKVLTYTGLVHIIWKFLPNGVYVFNYHRIGDRDSCPYDREVYSCTSQSFDRQLQLINETFEVISMKELEEIMSKNKFQHKKYALITFDDGYIDNYIEAFPLLKKHNVSATFYVTTDYVGQERVPWWDEIAFLLRQSIGEKYQLPFQKMRYELATGTIEFAINRIIYEAKRLQEASVLDVLNDIRVKFPNAVIQFNRHRQRLFMDWTQLKEMANSGMFIGSHTLSHQVLSKLNSEDQARELQESKQIIESNLRLSVESVVYPVGRYHCYTNETCHLAKQSGYKFGFNNEPGRVTKMSDPYDFNRFCIGTDNLIEFKLYLILHL